MEQESFGIQLSSASERPRPLDSTQANATVSGTPVTEAEQGTNFALMHSPSHADPWQSIETSMFALELAQSS